MPLGFSSEAGILRGYVAEDECISGLVIAGAGAAFEGTRWAWGYKATRVEGIP